jgi:hypothetical protein
MSTNSNGKIIVSKDVNHLPTATSGIDLDYIGGVDNTTSNPLYFTRTGMIVKDQVDADKIVTYTKKIGSNNFDPRYGSMFLQTASGRIGWGDKTRSYNPDNNNFNIDVYLDRKAPNTLGVDDGDSLRVGRTTTANRPDASVMGAGAMMFDTTINRQIVSNGTVWEEFGFGTIDPIFINPTDPAPTTDGTYKPVLSSKDNIDIDPVNYGTLYNNAGGLRAKEGYDTLFNLENGVWKKYETKIDVPSVTDIYNLETII